MFQYSFLTYVFKEFNSASPNHLGYLNRSSRSQVDQTIRKVSSVCVCIQALALDAAGLQTSACSEAEYWQLASLSWGWITFVNELSLHEKQPPIFFNFRICSQVTTSSFSWLLSWTWILVICESSISCTLIFNCSANIQVRIVSWQENTSVSYLIGMKLQTPSKKFITKQST